MLVFIFIKIKQDVDIYQQFHSLEDNMLPSLLAGGIRINFYSILLFLVSFIFCLLGFRFKNSVRVWTLIVNIVGIVYLLIPTVFLIIT